MKTNKLYNRIYKYQDLHNKNDLEELIVQFKPLLKKYAVRVSFEDSMQDLIVTLIETLNKIPLSKIKEEKYILSYITTSIKNAYIKLSSRNSKDSKVFYESDILENIVKEYDDISRIDMIDLLDVLSDREKYILYCIFFKSIPIEIISKKFHTSRQYINQTKLNALKKLKKELT